MTEGATAEARHSEHSYHFDRHTPQYRDQFEPITSEMLGSCPLAWTDTYGGHWVAAGSSQVFELARCPHISNDNDVVGERKGYRGINIPRGEVSTQFRGGMLEMDDPEHRSYRTPLNGYLSPAGGNRSSTNSSGRVWTRKSKTAVSISSTIWRTSCRLC